MEAHLGGARRGDRSRPRDRCQTARVAARSRRWRKLNDNDADSAVTTGEEPRTAHQRKADTLAKLAAPAADVWVASAGMSDVGTARPYLVPLSLAWLDERIVLALEASSQTARNIAAAGEARLALGPTRDVVVVDAVLEARHPAAEVPTAIGEGYAAQSDWDPRAAGEGYLYLVLRPVRIQAWREANELPGRTIMRAGAWLV